MYIAIDNTLNTKIVLYYASHPNSEWEFLEYERDQYGSVLECLSELASRQHLKLSDIDGIAAIVGAGRFTATRVATTIANILAYALSIPVVPWPGQAPLPPPEQMFAGYVSGRYALPVYSAPPTISGSRKELVV